MGGKKGGGERERWLSYPSFDNQRKFLVPVGERSLNFFCHFSKSALVFFCSLVGPNHPWKRRRKKNEVKKKKSKNRLDQF